jgi:hypothetical protein
MSTESKAVYLVSGEILVRGDSSEKQVRNQTEAESLTRRGASTLLCQRPARSRKVLRVRDLLIGCVAVRMFWCLWALGLPKSQAAE